VLSVFADGFDLAAAQEVAGAAVVAGLVRLVDASLVLAVELEDGRLRYRMLETLRQYGRERLRRDGRYDEAVRRVVGWATGFAELAEHGLRGPDEASWVHRIEIEFANLRAAWSKLPALATSSPRLGSRWRSASTPSYATCTSRGRGRSPSPAGPTSRTSR
jgi:predicted ATPase